MAVLLYVSFAYGGGGMPRVDSYFTCVRTLAKLPCARAITVLGLEHFLAATVNLHSRPSGSLAGMLPSVFG